MGLFHEYLVFLGSPAWVGNERDGSEIVAEMWSVQRASVSGKTRSLVEESVLSPEEQENLIDVFRILKLWREKRHERLRLEECEAADNVLTDFAS